MLFKKKLISTLTLFVNNQCNLKCIYCFEDEKSSKPLLTFEEYTKIVKQAKGYGANTVVIVGKEPLLYDKIFHLIDCIFGLKMRVIFYTNGTLLSRSSADFICKKNVDTHIKLDTLNEKCYNKLTNQKVGFQWTNFEYNSNGKKKLKKIPIALKYLIEAYSMKRNGFAPGHITIEVCANKMNYKNIPELAQFCKDNNLIIRVERLIKKGRGKDNYKTLKLSEAEYHALFYKLVKIAGDYFVRYNQEKACLARGSLVIHEDGEAGLCAVQRSDKIGNIRDQSMRHIIEKKIKITNNEGITYKNNFKICAGRCYLNLEHQKQSEE